MFQKFKNGQFKNQKLQFGPQKSSKMQNGPSKFSIFANWSLSRAEEKIERAKVDRVKKKVIVRTYSGRRI